MAKKADRYGRRGSTDARRSEAMFDLDFRVGSLAEEKKRKGWSRTHSPASGKGPQTIPNEAPTAGSRGWSG